MMKVEVCLEASEFIRFGMFDTFRHRKSWVRPALFAAILAGSAAVCFALHERRGAALLGTVLLVVALGLPAAWFLSFFLSLRRQAQEQKLADKRYVYTVELHDSEAGISVDNGREHTVFLWEQLLHAYRRPHEETRSRHRPADRILQSVLGYNIIYQPKLSQPYYESVELRFIDSLI